MKNVLIIYYSQSGQLESIARTIAKPLVEAEDVTVTFYEIEMEKPFPFPWSNESFFNVFPEAFLQVPSPFKPVSSEILNTKYDLVLLHYQVWYLSPSIPVNSFLKSTQAKLLLNDTPVVTINGSRNMWIMAQEKIKRLLQNNNAALKGNIALVDRSGNLISVITIVKWMFSGVKEKYLGIFPLPGVSKEDIVHSEKFGEIILSNLRKGDFDQLQQQLLAQDAVRINAYLVKVDKIANKIFDKWSHFISRRKQSRQLWLRVFKIYLWVAIWLVSPIVYILYIASYPFKISSVRREREYYRAVHYSE